ncbi:UDP-N-acetyl glucosamine 2-epimerase [Alsobacter metallidurans]|uniref:UDP-N-acetyl glucosamine 2-epimerase n=1 Tax=Alsobacter metallidurans TaxID=340221 RepID=A0A917I6H7_9HYPH|nr:UDP-N-acetylglucosamine 2-epimerase [Alsobacter metallidurans]GGH15594.1 UDP-N-acetyl glucosamine 2-epimerase [Alsobacter metallidurans]
MALHVAIVTGSRADWGLLAGPARALADRGLRVSVIATGQHLGPANTLEAIRQDGFEPADTVDILLAADTGAAAAKAMGLLQIGLAETLGRLAPDLLLVLGDRYEILAAVSAALVMRIPVAHIAGGDITEGAMDDAIRHAITKMASLHFTTTEEAAARVRAMGEPAGRVHAVGSPGIDRIRATALLTRDETFAALGLPPTPKLLVVTFHPVTLSDSSRAELAALLDTLGRLGPEFGLVFTGVNADPDGATLDRDIAAFCARRPNAVHRGSLGSRLYFSAVAAADAVVGNSSSGLYEVPSFGKPTVDVGDRQKGRLRASSVVHCAPTRDAIAAAIAQALAMDASGAVNPYGDGRSSARIADVIAAIERPRDLLRKPAGDAP